MTPTTYLLIILAGAGPLIPTVGASTSLSAAAPPPFRDLRACLLAKAGVERDASLNGWIVAANCYPTSTKELPP